MTARGAASAQAEPIRRRLVRRLRRAAPQAAEQRHRREGADQHERPQQPGRRAGQARARVAERAQEAALLHGRRGRALGRQRQVEAGQARPGPGVAAARASAARRAASAASRRAASAASPGLRRRLGPQPVHALR